MAENVLHEPLETLPYPLRKHVAQTRIRQRMYPPLGSEWVETTVPPTAEEYAPTLMSRRVVHDPPAHLVDALTAGRTTIDDLAGVPTDPNKDLVQSRDGRWFQPVDTRRKLDVSAKASTRYVTPALRWGQSEQLITAFYFLSVERARDEDTLRAFALIMFHSLKERGYTARWLGKYDQTGRHTCNGDKNRKFLKHTHYAPHQLPASVLNRCCGPDGKLRNRGSKGSRSKYKTDKQRYVPQRRLKRSREDEDDMRVV
jgi:hypothetical protein